MIVFSVSGHIFIATSIWLTAWTMNGDLLAKICLPNEKQAITCIHAASLHEWQTHKNMALVSGHVDGTLRFWTLEIPKPDDVK